jgi:hypothetical protein
VRERGEKEKERELGWGRGGEGMKTKGFPLLSKKEIVFLGKYGEILDRKSIGF